MTLHAGARARAARLLGCGAAGHGTDSIRHDGGPAAVWVRNLHPCWGAPMVPVCGRFGAWLTVHADEVHRCRACGEASYLQDWAFVIRRVDMTPK